MSDENIAIGCWLLRGVYNRSVTTAHAVRISWPDGARALLTRCGNSNQPKSKLEGWAALFTEIVDGAEKLDASAAHSATAIVLDLDDCLHTTPAQVFAIVCATWPNTAIACWETYRSRPGTTRMRILFPLATPIAPSQADREWRKASKMLAAASGLVADPHHELSRLHLLPVAGKTWTVCGGKPLLVPQHRVERSNSRAVEEETPCASNRFDLPPDTVLVWEVGHEHSLKEITPEIVQRKSRTTEVGRARCRCPVKPEENNPSSFSSFARFCRTALYVTCTSAHHGHASGQTWIYRPNNDTASVVPYPYREDGGVLVKQIKAEKEDDRPTPVEIITHTAPRIANIYKDEESGDEWWRLDWNSTSGSRSVVLRRDECSAALRLIDRAGRAGLDIHEVNKRELTKYLSAYVQANRDTIPQHVVASRMGWFDDGFLLGDQWLGNGQPRELVVPSGDGRRQIADAMRTTGTLEGWFEAIRQVAAFPLCIAGLLASLSSVLVSRIGCQPLIFEWASSTGSGKTSCLRLAASAWGEPDGLLAGWDSTRAALERRAAFLSSLPLFLDDTKTVAQGKNSIDPEWAVYRVTSGEGRDRATPGGGSATTAKWQLNLLSTGEEPIYGTGQAGGARARIVTVQDPPFGLTTKDEVSRIVAGPMRIISAHYGHVGPMIIQAATQIGSERLASSWASRRSEWLSRYSGRHSAADRVSNHLALLDVTARLLDATVTRQQIDTPPLFRSAIDAIGEALCLADSAHGAADPVERAVGEFYSWCVQHRGGFWTAGMDYDGTLGKRDRAAGWFGRWDGGDSWTDLYVTPRALGIFLVQQGYASNPRAMALQWLQRGALVLGAHRGMWKIGIAGAADWAYRLNRTVVDDGSPVVAVPDNVIQIFE